MTPELQTAIAGLIDAVTFIVTAAGILLVWWWLFGRD